MIQANTPVVTIFGKTWDLHVREVLRTSMEENLRMIQDTVAYIKSHDKEVIYDAEHFFDGYKADPEYALETLRSAIMGGADAIVLCDTNGGCLPWEVAEAVDVVRREVLGQTDGDDDAEIPASDVVLGIHAHNDSETGVANTLAAVQHGATHIQGTINGYGERCGNANLVSVIPDLQLKMGYRSGAAGETGSTHRHQPLCQRAGKPQPGYAPALRGSQRLCAQGRHACQRRGEVHDELSAHRPRWSVGNETRVLRQRVERQGQHCGQAPGVRPGRV